MKSRSRARHWTRNAAAAFPFFALCADAAYQDGMIDPYACMTREQHNSSLDILEASTGVRPKIEFEEFVDHSLCRKSG